MKINDRSIIVNTCLTLISLGLSLFLVEGLTRAFFSVDVPEFSYNGMWEPHPGRAYRMVPNLSGTYTWREKQISFQTNSLGMRDVEFGEKRKGQFRVLVLGDSFAWGGNGLNLDETFPKVTEKILGRTFRDVIVMNSGHGGYGTSHELEFLRENMDVLKPDLVVLQFYDGNDFSDNVGITDMVVLRNVRIYKQRLNRLRQSGLTAEYFLTLLEHSHFFRLMFYTYFSERMRKFQADESKSQWRDFPGDDMPQVFSLQDKSLLNSVRNDPLPFYKHAYEVTYDLIRKIRDYCNSHNVGFALLSIPHEASVSPKKRNKLLQKYALEEVDFDFSLPTKRLAEFCNAENMACVFLLDGLRREVENGRKMYWETDVHLNVSGNIFAAEQLAAALLRLTSLGKQSDLAVTRSNSERKPGQGH